MSPTDDITLPDGSTVEVPADTVAVDIGYGVLTVHTHAARLRTIERWRDLPVFAAIRDAVAAEYQELENAAWQVLISRFVDDAFGEGLNMIGRIVGEPRDGRDDPSYRVRIKARVRVNQSQGLGPDILAVAAILEPTNEFILTWTPPAAFVLTMVRAPSGFASASEFAALIGEATAAGIGGFVVMPTDSRPLPTNFVLGDAGGAIDTSTIGDAHGFFQTDYIPDGRFI